MDRELSELMKKKVAAVLDNIGEGHNAELRLELSELCWDMFAMGRQEAFNEMGRVLPKHIEKA